MKTEERSRHTVWMKDAVWQKVQEQYKSDGSALAAERNFEQSRTPSFGKQSVCGFRLSIF